MRGDRCQRLRLVVLHAQAWRVRARAQMVVRASACANKQVRPRAGARTARRVCAVCPWQRLLASSRQAERKRPPINEDERTNPYHAKSTKQSRCAMVVCANER
eukprot:5056622-Pleurochrysis_carterae.AAC.2